MPADDLVLNVRQIANYPAATLAPNSAAILMQTAGLGSPYASITPALFVGTALANGGNMAIAGKLAVQAISGGSAQFSNAVVNLFAADQASVSDLCITFGTIGGVPIASAADLAALAAKTVASFNGRSGNVRLWIDDIICAGGAPIYSPRFTGSPRAETPPPTSNSSRLATTCWVHATITAYLSGLVGVTSFNTRTGDVVLTTDDITGAGGATEAELTAAIATLAPLDSPILVGFPTAPTMPLGNDSGSIATTAFVQNALNASVAGVASFNGRTGVVVLTTADITAAGGAPIASPALTGVPTGPTATVGTNTTQLATTAFVEASLSATGVSSFNTRTGVVTLTGADITGAGGALLLSPAFSGVPTGPTAAVSTSTTQLATTAFVQAAITAIDAGVLSFNGRTGVVALNQNDISAANGALLTSPTFSGVPSAPTAAPGTSTTQIATTGFVMAQIAASAVASFNGRSGAVTLTTADVTGAGGAPIASPTFTGVPAGPTAAPGTNTTQLASTAFVAAATAGSTNRILRVVRRAIGNGTYVPSAGMTFVLVELGGAGGGGGGAIFAGAAGSGACGGGGGSGSYAVGIATAAQVGAGIAVTLGLAGTGGPGASAGTAGGTTTFGGLMTAPGGAGGATMGGTIAFYSVSGGVGGSPGSNSLGGVNFPGNGGTAGITINGAFSLGGQGGAGIYGGGPNTIPVLPSGSAQGGPQGFAGAGGSGAGTAGAAGGSASATGGSGGPGWCMVTEFCTQ